MWGYLAAYLVVLLSFTALCIRRVALACRPAVSSAQLRLRPAGLARHQSALRPYADAQQPAACRAHQHRRRAACQEELRIPACFQLAARQLHLPSDPAERPCRALLQRRDAAWIAAAFGHNFFFVDLLPAAALAVCRRPLPAGLLRCFALSRVFRRREGLFRAFLRPGDLSAGISLVDGVRS